MIDYSLRIGIFLLLLSTLLLWQWRAPRKPLQQWRLRWRHNVSLLFVDSVLVRLCQPVILSLVALLPAFSYAPLPLLSEPIALLLALALMDALIYWQHRLFHTLPWLWRLHRVHHSDPELDVSSAVRFHPLEILLSLAIKALAVWLLGVPLYAVLLFDVLLNGFAMFNHTNVHIRNKFDQLLRYFVVTPDMHRIHHSRKAQEANSNYGFCLSIWDRLFRSYTTRSESGDNALKIGMPDTQHYAPRSLFELLRMPFTTLFHHKDSSS